MNGAVASPRIEALSWGRMSVEGLGEGKDFKLWPGGGRPWDWSETGTHHRPGIQPSDVAELVDRGSRVIVLSRGMLRMLGTCRETLQVLDGQGIRIETLETTRAVRAYNELVRRGTPVGGLFHSTC